MRGFLLLVKAAVVAVKLAAAAAKENSAPAVPITAPKAAPRAADRRTGEVLDMVTGINTVDMGYLRLRLNGNGSEYAAEIVSHGFPQDIIVPNGYGGLPVTEVRWESGDRHDNKVRLFIPETVKRLDLNVMLFSTVGKRRGRWVKLIIDERNPYLVTENRCVYSADKTVLWCAQCKTNYVTLPDTVEEIAPHAFTGNMHTLGVTLPPSVRIIGKGAFRDCESLRSINVENVVSIGEQAFMNCVKIREFICKRLRELGDRCFYGCEYLLKVKLPVTLTSVGSNVFRSVQYIEFFDNLKAPLRSFAFIASIVCVRSAKSGDVKYKVCLDKHSPPSIVQLHEYGWREYAEFDLEKHDRLFEQHCPGDPDCASAFMITALYRLGHRYKLTEHAREFYVDWIKAHADHGIRIGAVETEIKDFSALYSERIKGPRELAATMELCDLRSDHELKEQLFEMLEQFCRDGIYGADDMIALIDFFSESGRTEFTARLLELRNTFFPYGNELSLE